MIGQTIGNYVVRDKIGEGGMGVVYVAEHPRIGRKVAIKVLLPEYSQNPEVVARFFTEARASSAIKNEHIIDIIDFGELPDHSSYIIMEWLEGHSLTSVIERDGKLPADRVMHIARGIGRALAAAHSNGIVHRDLKPDNIFLVSRGDDHDFVKVLDFGIAKLLGDEAAPSAHLKTKTGAIIGTPMYMSPEQCRGVGVDERSDTYSFGVIVYQLIAGRLPFIAEGLGDILLAHMTETPPPLDAPPQIAHAVARALEKDPQKRPQRVTDFVAELTGRVTLPAAAPSPAHASPIDTLGAASGEKTTIRTERSSARWPLLLLPVALFGAAGAIYATRDHGDASKALPAIAIPAPVSTETPPPIVPPKVHVSVRATPSTAQISVDGVSHTNPYGEDVAPDAIDHHVEITAPGYVSYQTTVRFDRPVDIGEVLVPESSAQAPSKPDGKKGHEAKKAPTAKPDATPVVESKPVSKGDLKPAGKKDAPATDKPQGPTLYKGTKGTLQTEDPFAH